MNTDTSVCRGLRNQRRADIVSPPMKLISLVPIKSTPGPVDHPDQLANITAQILRAHSSQPIDPIKLCVKLAGVGRVDLMRESDQTFDVAFHTDCRSETSRNAVSCCTDLWVCKRIKMRFEVVPERASKVGRASIH